MTDQQSKHSNHMIIKLHAKTYPLLTKSNWTNSQTKNQIQIKSNKYPYDEKNNGKTKTFLWKISSTVISFTLKNTFQNDLFQKSNSKKKTENRPHPCNKTLRNPWTLGKKNPKSVSRKWKHASPPIRHLWTLYSASHYWVLHIKDLLRVSLPPKYLYSTSSASSETGRLPKHVFNIFFFCINSALGTRYFH